VEDIETKPIVPGKCGGSILRQRDGNVGWVSARKVEGETKACVPTSLCFQINTSPSCCTTLRDNMLNILPKSSEEPPINLSIDSKARRSRSVEGRARTVVDGRWSVGLDIFRRV